MNTILFIIVGVILTYIYLRGFAIGIISKHRMVKIVLTEAYDMFSSEDEEIRKLAPRPSVNMVKIFVQVIFCPFFRKTNNFFYTASREEILKNQFLLDEKKYSSNIFYAFQKDQSLKYQNHENN